MLIPLMLSEITVSRDTALSCQNSVQSHILWTFRLPVLFSVAALGYNFLAYLYLPANKPDVT